MFADIHNHLLPGVDDGSQTLDETFRMLDQALAESVSSFCLTPHVQGEKDELARLDELHRCYEMLLEEVDRRAYKVSLQLGCEIYCTTEIGDIAGLKEFSFGKKGRYILVELPPTEVPHYFAEMMFRVKLEGVTPILAHPERNMVLLRKPEILAQFLKMGVLTQVTAASLAGELGEQIHEFSRNIVRSGACTVVASDAHNTRSRSFASTGKAYHEAVQLLGESGAQALFADNPLKILSGEAVDMPEPAEDIVNRLRGTKKKRFFFFGKRQ